MWLFLLTINFMTKIYIIIIITSLLVSSHLSFAAQVLAPESC